MIFLPVEVVTAIYTLQPETLDVLLWPLRLIGITMVFEALGMTMQFALQGAGYTRKVMVVAVLNQWLVYLPLAYVVGPVLGFGLTAIWALNVSYRSVQSFIFVSFWMKGRWAEVKI